MSNRQDIIAKSTASSIVSSDKSIDSIEITLGGNRLHLNESTGKWYLVNSDLEKAVLEVEELVEDKELLTKSLEQSVNYIEKLQNEVVESNNLKAVVLEMLMEERKRRIELEEEIEGYKDELKNSYKVIIELK
eukprot:gene14265-19141_t